MKEGVIKGLGRGKRGWGGPSQAPTAAVPLWALVAWPPMGKIVKVLLMRQGRGGLHQSRPLLGVGLDKERR